MMTLTLRNHVHCLLMDTLGAIGLGKPEEARGILNVLYTLYPEYQGAKIHAETMLQNLPE